jgi:DNA mismatch endonuclease (patch repair protein)
MLGNRSESAREVALRSELHRRGMRFRKHLAPVRGLRCKPDIVFTRKRLVVFVDGCFWHRCPEHGSDPKANGEWWRTKLDANVARDRRNDAALAKAGWTVLRLWAHEPLDEMVARVLMVAGPSGSR